MTVDQITELLVAERDRLSAAITALCGEGQARRGRPQGTKNRIASPANPVIPINATAKTGSWERTPEQRAAQSKRAKAYWRKRRLVA